MGLTAPFPASTLNAKQKLALILPTIFALLIAITILTSPFKALGVLCIMGGASIVSLIYQDPSPFNPDSQLNEYIYYAIGIITILVGLSYLITNSPRPI